MVNLYENACCFIAASPGINQFFGGSIVEMVVGRYWWLDTAYSVIVNSVAQLSEKDVFSTTKYQQLPTTLLPVPCTEGKLYYESELVYPIIPALPVKKNKKRETEIRGFIYIVCQAPQTQKEKIYLENGAGGHQKFYDELAAISLSFFLPPKREANVSLLISSAPASHSLPSPTIPVQTPVLYCLCQMLRSDILTRRQVGYGSAYL